MANITPRRAGASWPIVLLILIGLFLVAGASLFLYVLVAGQITIPFTDPPKVISFREHVPPKPWSPPPGTVPVPVSGRDIDAYSKISRDDIWDLQRQTVSVIYLKEDGLSDVHITDVKQILGRVLAHDKDKGYTFTEDDFLPKGTRPGIVAGIPPGMRAMRVPLDKVRGLYGLNPGDRFDLIASLALEGDPADALKGYRGVYSDRVALESKLGNLSKQATVSVLVQNGQVVSPAQSDGALSPRAARKDPSGARAKSEVVIAVRPEEVAPLTEALTVEADLQVVPRSGHPDDDGTTVTPSSTPRSPFGSGDTETGSGMQLVETIGGKSRELIPVPEVERRTEK